MADLRAIGLRLRTERETKALNQEDFASLGGVKKNSQGLYETGKTPCTVEYLVNLADHGVDIGYVVTGRRADGSMGFEEKQLFEMFGKLSEREREAIMSMLMILTGYQIDIGGTRDSFVKALRTLPGGTLHSPATDYNGDDQP